jgi:hypothetical protein
MFFRYKHIKSNIDMILTILSQKKQDIIRQTTNLIFSLAQFLVIFLPALGIGIGIGDRAMTNVPQVQPIYWSFFIWFLIYSGCIVYGIYQALPAQRENNILRRVGFYSASAFTGVTAYALVAQSGGSDWILMGIFIWILISLLYAIFRLTEDQSLLTKNEVYTVLAPISLLAGWTSLAILINFAAVIKDSGIIPDGPQETVFSLIILVLAMIVASGILYKTKGNVWYALPVVWGLIGVIVANTGPRSSFVVAGSAALVALIVLGVMVFVHRDMSKSLK